jgi:hypothetical protein
MHPGPTLRLNCTNPIDRQPGHLCQALNQPANALDAAAESILCRLNSPEYSPFMKRAAIFLGALATGALVLVGAQNQNPPAELRTKEAMRMKLSHSQRVLEGITLEDFGLIQTNAVRLSQLARAAGWHARQTPEYELFTNEFRRNVDSLIEAAKDRNHDAASIAYVQMTFSCTACHKYLRGSKMASR